MASRFPGAGSAFKLRHHIFQNCEKQCVNANHLLATLAIVCGVVFPGFAPAAAGCEHAWCGAAPGALGLRAAAHWRVWQQLTQLSLKNERMFFCCDFVIKEKCQRGAHRSCKSWCPPPTMAMAALRLLAAGTPAAAPAPKLWDRVPRSVGVFGNI